MYCKNLAVTPKLLGFSTTIKAVALMLICCTSMIAQADVSVEWTSPGNGTEFISGSDVTLNGNANALGVSNGSSNGLDLVLVLDSSGSMDEQLFDAKGVKCSSEESGSCQFLREWQQDAAIALVEKLPAGARVSVVKFDNNAKTLQTLTALSDADGKDAIELAIRTVGASGSTNIASGIKEATKQFSDDGNSHQIIVFSDGSPTAGNHKNEIEKAMEAGVEAIHSVALPGSNLDVMNLIADLDHGKGTSFDATGINGLEGIINAFSSDQQFLSGLDRVDITLASGEVIGDIATDANGNFSLVAALLQGENAFTATAHHVNGSIAEATLTLKGINVVQDLPPNVSPVPIPASLPLFALALLGFAAIRRKLVKQ